MGRLLFILAFLTTIAFQGVGQEAVVTASEPQDSVYVFVKAIQVQGNEKTKENVILAESKINIGDSITLTRLSRELKKSTNNIMNTRLFNEVIIEVAEWDDSDITLSIAVKERWYLYPVPVFELTGINFQEWVRDFNADFNRLTYGVDVTHLNFRKRAERVKLSAKTGFQQEVSTNYFFTGIDKKRNIGLGFNARAFRSKGATVNAEDNFIDARLFENDFAVEGVRGSVFATYRKVINRRHSLRFSFTDLKAADTVLNLSPQFFTDGSNNQQNFSIAYGIDLEHRNLIEYPTEGYNVTASAFVEGIGNDALDIYGMNFIASTYSKVGKKTYLSGSAQGRYIDGGTIPFANLVSRRLDDDVIRGYEQYSLFPKSFFTLKSEFRYGLVDKKFNKVPLLPKQFEPLPFKIYPKLFFDAAKTESNQFVLENPLNDDLLYAAGFGVDIVSLYNTAIRLEMSQNHLKENNLSFSVGKSF